ncbi:MAG: DoxX family protein [Hyphomicrobiaceae bacterium]
MSAFLSPLGTTELALLLLRIVFGICVFKHGWGKLSHIDDLVTIWAVPLPLAWTVAVIQIAGACCMIFGLLTVPLALALTIVHAVATWKLITMANEPFVAPSRHSWSIGLLYTLIPLALAIAGPGAYSIDHLLLRN